MQRFSFALAQAFPKKRIKELETQRWFPKVFHGWSGLLLIQGMAAVQFLIKAFPWNMRFGLFHSKNNELSWFWNIVEQQRVRRILLDKIKKNRSFIADIKRRWRRDWEKFNQFSEKARTLALPSLPISQIVKIYEQIVWLVIQQAKWGYLVEPLHLVGEDHWFEQEAQSVSEKKIPEEMIAKLSVPITPSFSQEEQWSRGKLFQLFKKDGKSKSFDKALLEHCEKFATIHGNYFSVPLLNPKEVERSLYEIDFSKIQKQRKDLAGIKKEKQKIVRQYGLRKLMPLINAVEFLAHMQDWRKWGVTKVNAVIFQIMKELEKRLKIPKEILLEATPTEITALCQGKYVDLKKISERQKGALFWCGEKGVTIFTGRALKALPLEIFYGKGSSDGELKGAVAMKGFAIGIVRIVKTHNDIRAFKKGEILVTNNTTPEFVPAMKKAAAIVAEQGGITIHAAIISRELGIPCVIGTKIATRVFKNGDKAEVDAEKGVVRKL